MSLAFARAVLFSPHPHRRRRGEGSGFSWTSPGHSALYICWRCRALCERACLRLCPLFTLATRSHCPCQRPASSVSSALLVQASGRAAPLLSVPARLYLQGHFSLSDLKQTSPPRHVSPHPSLLPHLPLLEWPSARRQDLSVLSHSAHGLPCSEQREASSPHPPPLSKPCQVPEALPPRPCKCLPEGPAHSTEDTMVLISESAALPAACPLPRVCYPSTVTHTSALDAGQSHHPCSQAAPTGWAARTAS